MATNLARIIVRQYPPRRVTDMWLPGKSATVSFERPVTRIAADEPSAFVRFASNEDVRHFCVSFCIFFVMIFVLFA